MTNPIRNLIHHLWPLPGDIISSRRKGRHRGRPALVARRVEHHQGATIDWDPRAELEQVDQGEPEERLAEAAEREAQELARHRADMERTVEEEVAAECSAALDPKLAPLFAAVEDACQAALRRLGIAEGDVDRLLAAYRSAAEPTGGWPVVRELVRA